MLLLTILFYTFLTFYHVNKITWIEKSFVFSSKLYNKNVKFILYNKIIYLIFSLDFMYGIIQHISPIQNKKTMSIWNE